jgi:hypothetical protein
MFYSSCHAVKQLVRYAAQMGQKRIEIKFVTKNIFCTTLIHIDVIYLYPFGLPSSARYSGQFSENNHFESSRRTTVVPHKDHK